MSEILTLNREEFKDKSNEGCAHEGACSIDLGNYLYTVLWLQRMKEKKEAAEQKKKTQAARLMASKVVSSGLEVKGLLQKQMQDPDLWMLPSVIKKKAEKALKDLCAHIETAQHRFQDDAPAPYPEEFVSQLVRP